MSAACDALPKFLIEEYNKCSPKSQPTIAKAHSSTINYHTKVLQIFDALFYIIIENIVSSSG